MRENPLQMETIPSSLITNAYYPKFTLPEFQDQCNFNSKNMIYTVPKAFLM
jgi:hypothetical protein